MSDINSTNWSETAASNNVTPPDGWPEGQAPSTVNDCSREMMGALKRDWDRRGPTLTSAGTANAQTLTYTVAPTAYVRGDTYSFLAGAGLTNTGAATMNVNALGAKAIQLGGAALRGMEIAAGLVYTLMYDGTQFQIVAGCLAFTANSLINGGFEVWQRGAGGGASIAVAASTTAYTADRWYITTAANEVCHVSQQAGLTNGSRFCGRFQRDSGQTGTGAIVAGQPYATEMLVPLRGSKVTISGWLASGANWSPTSGNLTISLYQGTGGEAKRGGGFTSETTVVTTTVALTAGSSATFFSATSAAVLPTTAVQAELQITWTPVGTASTNDWFSIDDVKVEPNVGPTPFDRPKFVDEMQQCQRFYQKTFIYATAPVQALGDSSGAPVIFFPTGASGTTRYDWRFPVEMRSSGVTITTYNPVSANANWRDGTNAADRTASISSTSSRATSIALSAGVAASDNRIHATAEMEI